MPKGPNGQKRPADAVGLAVMVGRIATGEIEDTWEAPRTVGPPLPVELDTVDDVERSAIVARGRQKPGRRGSPTS